MATKTFKIGEYCSGGILTGVVKGKEVTIINKQWDFSKGTRRSSDQKNAEEIDRITVQSDDDNAENKLENWMTELSTSYHAGQILDWVKTKVELKPKYGW